MFQDPPSDLLVTSLTIDEVSVTYVETFRGLLNTEVILSFPRLYINNIPNWAPVIIKIQPITEQTL